MSDEVKKLNLRATNDKPLKITAEEIPNLVPEKILSQWMEGDDDPYFKVQKIDYPLMANGYNYVESFFESFISKLNRAPIPGSKAGHETSWGKRPPTDLLLVGAKIEKKKNGKGSVFFKNYIPKEGESGDNTVFIKENKSGMIDFSLVSYTRDERTENADGKATWNVVESMFGERNDAVGYGEGAMKQKTNNRDSDPEKNKGEGMSKKEEALQTLKTLKANAEITILEIASEIGLESQIITDEQKTNLSKFNAVKALCGETDPADFVSNLLTEKKENAAKVRKAKLNEVFGELKINEKENKARVYAEKILGDAELTEEKINEVKEDSIFKSLAAEIADVDSDLNRIGVSEGKKENIVSDHVEADY